MTEGVSNVIVKGSGRNGVVMETTTKCLCDLVQLGVPMATGLILEHLSIKVRLVSSCLPTRCWGALGRDHLHSVSPSRVFVEFEMSSEVVQNVGHFFLLKTSSP